MLLPAGVLRTPDVHSQQGPGRGAAAEAASERNRDLLSAGQVPDRGEQRAKLRPHRRVQREVRNAISFIIHFLILFEPPRAKGEAI